VVYLFKVEVSIIVPVYNSVEIIPELVRRIESAMNEINVSFEIILSEDCSHDNSWGVIKELAVSKKEIKGLRLSKNYGQWRSTLAGISRAKGRYIVTIDDDLEYEPYEIVKLYQSITSKDYHVVFGIPKDKYALQGKSNLLSKWRKAIMHKLWNSPATDSFRIFKRELVFYDDVFMPKVFIDAFIVHHTDRRFIGYSDISSNKRYAGVSNVSFFKKLGLFFLYRSHFKISYWPYAIGIALCLLLIFIFSLYSRPARGFLMLIVTFQTMLALINLVYLFKVLLQVSTEHQTVIIEEVNS
jgi:glycosyltransferase involved in cell wall biosynthesis